MNATDPEKVRGDSYTLDLDTRLADWWTVSVKNFTYGDQSVMGNFTHAILDTGTSLLAFEESTYDIMIGEMMNQSDEF